MKRILRNSAIVNILHALLFFFAGTALVPNVCAQNLVGTWNLTEGSYNGNAISNLQASFTVKDNGEYRASFNDGTNRGSVTAKYTTTSGSFRTNITGNRLILNGFSSEFTIVNGQVVTLWSASMNCNSTIFNQWGGTAIGFGNPSFSVNGDVLTLTSTNGRTVLKYERDIGDVVETKALDVSRGFTLNQNYPNPFNPSTTVPYSLSARAHVTLKVYDLAGREVATLVDEIKSAGEYRVTFRADHLPSGAYIYRLQAGKSVETRQMLLMK